MDMGIDEAGNGKLPAGIQDRDSGPAFDVSPWTDLANAIILDDDCAVPQNRTTVAIEDGDVVDDEAVLQAFAAQRALASKARIEPVRAKNTVRPLLLDILLFPFVDQDLQPLLCEKRKHHQSPYRVSPPESHARIYQQVPPAAPSKDTSCRM